MGLQARAIRLLSCSTIQMALAIFLMLGWLVFFWTLHTVVQRRLEYLKTLLEDYNAIPSRSSRQSGPDDLIDLKLP